MKRRTADAPLNKMVFLRATRAEQLLLKEAARARGLTMSNMIWQAIYTFLGWK